MSNHRLHLLLPHETFDGSFGLHVFSTVRWDTTTTPHSPVWFQSSNFRFNLVLIFFYQCSFRFTNKQRSFWFTLLYSAMRQEVTTPYSPVWFQSISKFPVCSGIQILMMFLSVYKQTNYTNWKKNNNQTKRRVIYNQIKRSKFDDHRRKS